MGLRSWMMAKLYDYSMKGVEEQCLSLWRKELLRNTRGYVLELGAGTGLNLLHYPSSVEELVLSEPDASMRAELKKKLRSQPTPEVTLLEDSAESLSVPNFSVEFVVSILVLCSVNDLDASLKEIRRVLKPGGKLLLIEHVKNPNYAFNQRLLEPFRRFFCGNCHLTRDTKQALERNGFRTDKLVEAEMQGAPKYAAKSIVGAAQLAGTPSPTGA